MTMGIYDADIAAGINPCFRCAAKFNRYFNHIVFLETSKTFSVLPGGLKITNVLFIIFVMDGIKISCHNPAWYTEKDVLEKIILGIEDKRISLETL